MDSEPISQFSIRQVALLAVTGLLLYLCFLILRPFLPTLAWALALGIVTGPAYDWIFVKIKRPNVSAGIAIFLVTLMVLTPLSLVTNQIIGEVAHFTSGTDGKNPAGLVETMKENEQINRAMRWLDKTINLDIQEGVSTIVNKIGTSVPTIVSGSVWSIIQFLLILFTLFYFYRDKHRVLEEVRSLIPLKKSDTSRIFKRVADTIHATIYGSVVVAIAQGTLGGLMFWWLGLPAPAFWGFVMTLFAVVPYLGAFAIWGPVAIYFAMKGDVKSALLLTAWGSLAIGLIDNLLYPFLVGSRLRYHTLPVFFFLLGGVWLFGGSGLILGPVTLAVSDALIHIWRYRESA